MTGTRPLRLAAVLLPLGAAGCGTTVDLSSTGQPAGPVAPGGSGLSVGTPGATAGAVPGAATAGGVTSGGGVAPGSVTVPGAVGPTSTGGGTTGTGTGSGTSAGGGTTTSS